MRLIVVLMICFVCQSVIAGVIVTDSSGPGLGGVDAIVGTPTAEEQAFWFCEGCGAVDRPTRILDGRVEMDVRFESTDYIDVHLSGDVDHFSSQLFVVDVRNATNDVWVAPSSDEGLGIQFGYEVDGTFEPRGHQTIWRLSPPSDPPEIGMSVAWYPESVLHSPNFWEPDFFTASIVQVGDNVVDRFSWYGGVLHHGPMEPDSFPRDLFSDTFGLRLDFLPGTYEPIMRVTPMMLTDPAEIASERGHLFSASTVSLAGLSTEVVPDPTGLTSDVVGMLVLVAYIGWRRSRV